MFANTLCGAQWSAICICCPVFLTEWCYLIRAELSEGPCTLIGLYINQFETWLTSNDSVDGLLKVPCLDGLVEMPGSDESCFIAHISDVSTYKHKQAHYRLNTYAAMNYATELCPSFHYRLNTCVRCKATPLNCASSPTITFGEIQAWVWYILAFVTHVCSLIICIRGTTFSPLS